jgi:D-glycero-D-manno-heptose 1,7-bisphosphate phosphatase
MNAAVFLDRDNTLIHNDGDLGDPAKVRLMQGVASAVASLCGLGYKVVVITNQGGVARGRYTVDDVDAVHDRLSELLAAGANGAKIDRYYACPYHPEGTVRQYRMEHHTRKPAPGMLHEAARDLELDLSQSWTIGDQVRDVQAGLAAGTRAILLRQDADRLKPFDPREHPGLDGQTDQSQEKKATPDFYARNLVEAVRIVAQQRKPETGEQIHLGGASQRKWDAAAVAKLQRERKPAIDEEAVSGIPIVESKSGAADTHTETKPFRPWNVPVAELDEQAVSPATPVPPDTAAQSPAPAEPTAPPAPQIQKIIAKKTARPHEAESSQAVSNDADEKTLRLILQELRNQRGMGAEFSYTRIMAILLQTVAGACLLGAFWLGTADNDLFLRLICSAVFTQLAVIAALQWDR